MNPSKADAHRDLTLLDAALADGRRIDVTIADGRIAALGPVGTLPARDGPTLACGGRLLVPSFVKGTSTSTRPCSGCR